MISEEDKIYIKACEEYRARIFDEEFVSFDGQNCDDCQGWDGESSRCECGNRRISLEVITDTDRMKITADDLYPVAY